MTAAPALDEFDLRRAIAVGLPPLAVSAALAAVCWLAAGANLGLYLGGIAMATLVAAPLALGWRRTRDRLLSAAGVIDGVGLVWLLAIFASDVSLAQWLLCYLVLAAYVIAVVGLAGLVERVGLPGVLAAAIVTILALAWLTWPVWLAPALGGAQGQTVAGWLVPAHPLLAINGVLAGLDGPWPERYLAYQLMNLGQDVPYRLPSAPWAAVLAHGLAGAVLLLLGAGLGQRRHVRPAVDEPDAGERQHRE